MNILKISQKNGLKIDEFKTHQLLKGVKLCLDRQDMFHQVSVQFWHLVVITSKVVFEFLLCCNNIFFEVRKQQGTNISNPWLFHSAEVHFLHRVVNLRLCVFELRRGLL